jgi:hypothetical protein
MQLNELKLVASLPENKLVIPDSVTGLMGITMFWSPSMDRKYSKYPNHREPDPSKVEKITRREGKKERGLVWRKAHQFLNNLGQTITKEKLIKVYKSIDKNN